MKYKHSKEEVAALCKNASTCTECEFYNGAHPVTLFVILKIMIFQLQKT